METIDLAEQLENIPSLLEKYKQAAFLDVRDKQQVKLAHLNNSAHIPLQQLTQRVAELPHKKIRIVLIGDSILLQQAADFLISRKYKIETCLNTDKMKPHLWQKFINEGFAKEGEVEQFLWSANLFLKQQIETIESKLGAKNCSVLDIGCGSGREAVYLAKRGWQVTAVDNQTEAIQRLQHLAQFNKVSVNALQKNIIEDEAGFEKSSFDLIIMFRFLHRPLFEKIKDWLKPGGYFLCETFSIEAAKFGKPRRTELLLKPGELSEHFADWQVSTEYQRNLSDGRPLLGCIVRKP